jgi:hypothetical protein
MPADVKARQTMSFNVQCLIVPLETRLQTHASTGVLQGQQHQQQLCCKIQAKPQANRNVNCFVVWYGYRHCFQPAARMWGARCKIAGTPHAYDKQIAANLHFADQVRVPDKG